MELAQIWTMEPLGVPEVAARLEASLPAAALERRGVLKVGAEGPWRPADRWTGGLERLLWSVTFEAPTGRFVQPDHPALAGLVRRDHPFHPGEVLGRQLAGAFVLLWSDAWQMISVAVYRERRLRWSVLLQGAHGGREPEDAQVHETPTSFAWDSGTAGEAPTSRMVRCDGDVVVAEAPVRWVPEGDRTGVLLAGIAQFLRAPVELDFAEQLTLVDNLASPADVVVYDGRWRRFPQRRAG